MGLKLLAGALNVGLTQTASRSKIYSEPWVEEALYHYLYSKSQKHLHELAH